jgi:galactokinase/mevalonate kinase-like predicted kinase
MKSALKTGDLLEVGRLMSDNWDHQTRLYKRGVTELITTPAIDAAHAAARHGDGIMGFKCLGAGSGGVVAILARPNSEHRVRKEVERALAGFGGFVLDGWTIDYQGLSAWSVDETNMSA